MGVSTWIFSVVIPYPSFKTTKIFQQDNAPCHKSFEVLNFMEENAVLLMPMWPSCSPDLNLIENVWIYLKQNVGEHTIHTVEELWVILQEEFYKIPNDYFDSLYNSMSRRVQQVIDSKSFHIAY